MRVTTAVAAAAAAVLLFTIAASPATAVATKRVHTPVLPMSRVWAPAGPAPPDAMHLVTFHLRRSPAAVRALDAKFWAIVDPSSPHYGQYLSQHEMTQLVAPPEKDVATVVAFLREGGAMSVDVAEHRDVVSALMPVRAAQELFGVRFQAFKRVDDGRVRFRAARSEDRDIDSVHPDDHVPRLPAAVAAVTELVQGLTDLPPPMQRTGSAAKRAASDAPPVEVPDQSTLEPGQQNITRVLARGGDVFTIAFNVMCADGSPTTNPTVPCADHPPALASIVTNITSLSDGPIDAISKILEPTCEADPATGLVACTVTIQLEYYRKYNISLNAMFGQDAGPSSSFIKGVVATPPVTPLVLDHLYNIPPGLTVTNDSATQAVVEFEQQFMSFDDLTAYLSAMGRPYGGNVTIVGPNNASNPGGEANLDVQWIMGVAASSKPLTTFWSIKYNQSAQVDDMLGWATAMSNTKDPPLVNSISYGMPEALVDYFMGSGYVARTNAEFQKLGMRGLTILIAVGDTGVGDLGAAPYGEPTCEVLHPDWPGVSPYVVGVGSTFVTPNAQPACYAGGAPGVPGGIDCLENPLGEVVVGLDQGLFWTTGGGFSNIAPMPDYQKAAVEAYLSDKSAIPPAAMFNASGRAAPDVATVGHNLETMLSGAMIPIDGTSASTPIMAGIVTLLNDARLNAGMPPVGFVTPALYSIAAAHPDAFFDVVVGTNKCGAYGQGFGVALCCDAGYEARPGWDGASGLGTPNFEVLVREVLRM